MDKEEKVVKETKKMLSVVLMSKVVLIVVAFVLFPFMFLYSALHVEIDMEAVDCLIVGNCDGSEGGVGKAKQEEAEGETVTASAVQIVKERKKESQSTAKQVASGFGHQSEIYQPISDIEIKNFAAQIIEVRLAIDEKGDLQETAEQYGKVPKMSMTIGSVGALDMDHWEMALLASQKTGWHPLLIISQWQHETGHFTSPNFINNNNIAGQTWSPSSKYPKGTARPKDEGGWYIKYPNAVDGYVEFILVNPRYSNVKTFQTPEEQAKEVARAGWAKDPLYASKLIDMIEGNRKKYGEGNQVVPAPSEDAGASVPGEEAPTTDGDKVVQEAYRMYETRGVNSSNPMRYSMNKRGQEAFGDCSEFTQMVYQKALGINIGSTTIMQIMENAEYFNTDKSQLKPGDLVYFNTPGNHGHTQTVNGKSVTVDHTGIYVGDNKFIDMSSGKDGISVKDIGPGGQYANYFNKSFIGFVRVGTPGTGNALSSGGGAQGGFYTQNGETYDEAELHIRALINTDWYAIDELFMFELDKKGKPVYTTYPGVNGEVRKLKKEFEGTNVEDTYLIAMSLASDKKSERQKLMNYVSEKRHKNWVESDWMLNVRFLVYNCYMVGDNPPNSGNIYQRFKEWITGVFEDGPCETLDKYWQLVTEDDDAVYIPIEDREVLTHTYTRYEYTYTCHPPPDDDDDDEVIQIKGKQRGTASYATHKDVHVGKDEHNCQYGYDLDITPKIYPQYPSLYSGPQEKSILKNFEKYSLIVPGINTMKGETYPTEIERILRLFYGDALDQNELSMISTVGGGTDFIVPMEDGTYNYSSAFRSSHRPTHNGVDMGTLGVTGVPIYSTSNGIVASTGWVNGYGYTVMVQHTNGYYSFYAHMLEDYIVVKKGQTVSQAQLVGGVDGVPDLEDHLHFEVCERAVEAASGNMMCADHVDPEEDDDSSDGRPDEVKLTFNASQDMKKATTASTKFLSDWKEKAKNGSLFIMPGFSAVTGSLSQGFESTTGDCVNNASDYGGMSCGFYQFANTPGKVCGFVNWLGNNGYSDYYNVFSAYCPGGVTKVSQTNAFMSTWHSLKTGDAYPADFKTAQHIYIKSLHYDPVVNNVKKNLGLDINTRHVAVQEMIWSIGVQQPAHAVGMFKTAGFSSSTNWSNVTDREIIEKVYQARYDGVQKYFSSSPTLWKSLRNRFTEEKEKALAMLGGS